MTRLLFISMLAGLAQATQAQSFSAPTKYYIGGQIQHLAVADLNNDGYPDVVTVNYSINKVAVLLNNGNGTYAAPVSYLGNNNSGYNPLRLAVADLNNDARPDIVAIDPRIREANVLLNNGNGTFATYVTYPTSGTSDSPITGILADVTGDGYPDLVTVNSNSQAPTAPRTVSVLRNNGNGTFAAPVLYSTGSSDGSGGLAVADVNNDGRLDIVTTQFTAGQTVVLLNTGNGAFAAAGTYATGVPNSYAVRTGDLNRDGYPDLVVAGNGSGYGLGVLLNNRNGTFAAPVVYTVGQSSSNEPLTANSLTVADVNGDTYPDVLVGAYGAVGTDKVNVLLNTRAGGALGSVTRFTGSGSVDFIETGDVNRDNKPDILVISLYSSTLDVRLNQTTFLAARSPLADSWAEVFPNPAAGPSSLAVTNLPAEVRQLDATLLSTTGQPVRRLVLPVVQGAAQAALPTAGLAAGLYLLRVVPHDAQGTAGPGLPLQRVVVP